VIAAQRENAGNEMGKERDGRGPGADHNPKTKEMFFVTPVSKSFPGVSQDRAFGYQKSNCRHALANLIDTKCFPTIAGADQISRTWPGRLVSFFSGHCNPGQTWWPSGDNYKCDKLVSSVSAGQNNSEQLSRKYILNLQALD